MKPATPAHLAVLAAAPIALELDYGHGDPHKTPRYLYHGVNGRAARTCWDRGWLVHAQAGSGRLVLRLTHAGRALLETTRKDVSE